MDSNLLVRDMIKAIESKELKIVELAEQYGFSDRTIQSKIKKLGFEWIAKESRYNFVGTDESVFDIAIAEVFKKASSNASDSKSKNTIEGEVKKASNEVASAIQSNNKNIPEKNIKNTSNNTSKNDGENASDNIDRLLSGKKAKKEYRGFYLDSDVMGVIDSVGNGVKSELVNECLRKVFKEKGLL
ncbi:hypothetical protein [Peribacillus loiseleuriae]|uniref:hypothetical protein n=1 Tax=Peribacillus loiseleuriae TaxID=1679170 RepID=UPI003D008427